MFHRFLLCTFLLAALPPAARAADPVALTVYPVNYPLQYFAQRIAGDGADIVFPAPDDVDPAYWQPDTDTLAEYQTADLVLLNGAGYAKWVDRVSLPRRALVDTSAGFRDRYIHIEDSVTHSHGPGGDHSHRGTAFTTWLDPELAAAQAQSIEKALARKRPGSAQVFSRNLDALETDLRELDDRTRSTVAADPDRPLLASHPVYQYLARAYGLNLASVHWEPDRPPDEAQWNALERLLERHPARWMLWEGEPAPETVERLRALGVDSLVFDPAANRPGDGDFLDAMQRNAANLERAYR